MATYNGSVKLKNSRARSENQNESQELVSTVLIPSGTALANGDILNFGQLGENQRVTAFTLMLDQFDSNATAALAGRLGITASDACFIAAATVLQTNTTGAKNFARVDGEATAADSFAVTPFPAQTTVQNLILTISAAAGTAVTNTDRYITLRVNYISVPVEGYVSGVSNTTYPLAGAKVVSAPVVYTYNSQAP